MKNPDVELSEKTQWEFARAELKREQERTGNRSPFGSDGLIPFTRLERDLYIDSLLETYWGK